MSRSRCSESRRSAACDHGSGSLSGNNTSNLILNSSLGGSEGTLRFTSGFQSLNNFTFNLSGQYADGPRFRAHPVHHRNTCASRPSRY